MQASATSNSLDLLLKSTVHYLRETESQHTRTNEAQRCTILTIYSFSRGCLHPLPEKNYGSLRIFKNHRAPQREQNERRYRD